MITGLILCKRCTELSLEINNEQSHTNVTHMVSGYYFQISATRKHSNISTADHIRAIAADSLSQTTKQHVD